MASNLLTDAKCKNATHINTDGVALKIRKLSDGEGLYLWVHETGEKYWRYKYVSSGKEKLLSVGVYPATSLQAARKKACELRKQLADGVDPSAQRKEDERLKKLSTVSTFEAVARELYGKQVQTWAQSHALDVKRRLEHHIFRSFR